MGDRRPVWPSVVRLLHPLEPSRLKFVTSTRMKHLALFTANASVVILAPFTVVTAFMAFIPTLFVEGLPFIVGVAVAVGAVPLWPRPFDWRGLAWIGVYVLVMSSPLAWWIWWSQERGSPTRSRACVSIFERQR